MSIVSGAVNQEEGGRQILFLSRTFFAREPSAQTLDALRAPEESLNLLNISTVKKNAEMNREKILRTGNKSRYGLFNARQIISLKKNSGD